MESVLTQPLCGTEFKPRPWSSPACVPAFHPLSRQDRSGQFSPCTRTTSSERAVSSVSSSELPGLRLLEAQAPERGQREPTAVACMQAKLLRR